MDAQIKNQGSNELAERVKNSLAEPQHRFELQDPFMETTYRLPTAQAAIAQAEKLGAVGFQAVDTNNRYSQIRKIEGEWKSDDGKNLTDIQAGIDKESLRAIEGRAELRAAAGQGVGAETERDMARADAHAFRRIEASSNEQESAAVKMADTARANPEYKNALDKAIPGYPGTAEKVYALDAANTDKVMAKEDRKAAEYASMMLTNAEVEAIKGAPMQSLPGKRMIYNDQPGLAGVEVVNEDGSITGFGGKPAIAQYAQENKLSPGDVAKMLEIDALADKHRSMSPVEKENKPFRARENADKATTPNQHKGLTMNTISEGKPIPLTNGKADPNTRVPVPALSDLTNEIKSANELVSAGDKANSQARSSIVSRADLRNAAANEIAPPGLSPSGIGADGIDKETAKQWVNLDASEFGRMRSEERKAVAIDAIAGNMRASPDYAEALKNRSPALAAAGQSVNEEVEKQETARASAMQESLRQEEVQSRRDARLAEFDASAKASVARIRGEQLASVRVLLNHDPDPVLGKSDIADAQRIASGDGSVLGAKTESSVNDGQKQPEVEAEKIKILKRPILESELPQDIRSRFIVSSKQDRLFEKGTTDFHFRSGNKQGELAFYDAGKQLVTSSSDKATIASMVEIAKSKNWEEITVSGSDEFRRQAWLEARLANIEVRGFEPKDVDKQLLAEMQKSRSPENRIIATDNVRTLAPRTTKEADSRGLETHINVDELSAKEKSGLNQASTLLQSKELSARFSQAALTELEKKVRGERVYVGTAIDFGKAPYLFNKDNDPSYFVNLKTQDGEKTIWGKQLEQAIANGEVQRGQDIVLSNSGKKDVVVTEKVFNDAGKQTGIRNKAATLNEWKAEPLAKFTDRSVNVATIQTQQAEQESNLKREIQAPNRDR